MQETSDKKPESTPMGRIWKVVIGSMLAIAIVGFIWHTMTLSEQRLYDMNENARLQREIGKLQVYRHELMDASTTPEKLPQ